MKVKIETIGGNQVAITSNGVQAVYSLDRAVDELRKMINSLRLMSLMREEG